MKSMVFYRYVWLYMEYTALDWPVLNRHSWRTYETTI